MSEKRNLSELLTQDPPDLEKLVLYGRSKKNNLHSVDLVKLAVWYQMLKKKHSPLITPLHVACMACTKPELVRALVNEGWSVNENVTEFGSPLHIALEAGNISIAKLLIELGADTKTFHHTGCTPMFSALFTRKKEKNCIAAVGLLLDSGVSVNDVVNHDNERPIHIAIEHQPPSVVSFLLQKGANPNKRNINGQTPIHFAVGFNKLEIVKLLMLHGVNLDKKDCMGQTPLHLAVTNNYAKIVVELAKGGCDINSSDSNGSMALHTAVYLNRKELVKLLLTLGANPNKASNLGTGATPLHIAACCNIKESVQERIDIVECLVENGAILNKTDNSMETPLQVAINMRFISLAKFLIKLGADFNTRNRDGDTIFHQVAPLNEDITNLLLEFGGDYQANNNDGLTPYHLTIIHSLDSKYIKSFVKHGCPYDQNLPVWTDIMKQSRVGDTFFASEKKFFKGMKENNLPLVKRSVLDGAVPSSCCEDMKYPLHFVALQGYEELLTFLLEEHVQPNTVNEKGETPLYLAASQGHYNVCCVLLRYGACYNYQSKKCSKTPRMVASDLKHIAIVDLLDDIEYMFRKARLEKNDVVEYLKSKLDNNSDYLMFVSVTDIKGNTVIGTALQHKQYGNAEEMLKMKLQYNLDSDKPTN